MMAAAAATAMAPAAMGVRRYTGPHTTPAGNGLRRLGAGRRVCFDGPMCGIGGVAGGSSSEAEARALAMLRALRHRGPDDEGITVTGREQGMVVALCATRLAVRDLSARGHQPMTSPETGCTVVYNGELYNATELRAELEAAGRRFTSTSDTEVVLAAFDRWQEGAFQRLDGMFAFAISDPTSGRLLLARDPLGIKPLYYAQVGRSFAFASEVRTLLAAFPQLRVLSRAGLASSLATGAVVEPETILEPVRMLPPGTCLEFDGESTDESRFWSMDRAFTRRAVAYSRPEAAAKVRSALEDGVRRQLVSDAPLGVFLSGGLDSSALVGLVANAGVTPRTASLVFADQSLTEKPWIDPVVQRWGTDHCEIELSGEAFRRSLPTALEAMDQPTVDGLNTFMISRVARAEAGWTVALSGLGGDELFAGYSLYREIPRLRRARSVLPSLPTPAANLAARLRY